MALASMQRKTNVSKMNCMGLSFKICMFTVIEKFYLMIYINYLFQVRLPPEINRVLYIRNLPYKITAEEMYDIFGKYGAIRQIRVYVF